MPARFPPKLDPILDNPLVVQKMDCVPRPVLKGSASEPRMHRVASSTASSAFPRKDPATPPSRMNATLSPFFQVRAAEVLLPTWAPSNDLTRIRNIGTPLEPRDGGLGRNVSAPVLAQQPATPVPSPSRSAGASPPQKASSQVVISYPDLNPFSPEGKPQRQRPWQPAQKPKLTMRLKEMTWEDLPPPELETAGNISTSYSPEGSPTKALRKTFRMMQGLSNLRRLAASRRAEVAAETTATVGQGGPGNPGALAEAAEGEDGAEGEVRLAPPAAPEPASQPVAGHDDDLLHATLRELGDTASELAAMAEQMSASQQVIVVSGGARHATCVISQRALAVIKRKLDLLTEVEGRAAQIESAHAQREEIIARILSGNRELPPELLNLRKYISKWVHRPGEPIDADRSNFELFAAGFKLPSKHQALERLRTFAADYGDWWAGATLREATAGADYGTITCIASLAVNVGASEEHPMLLRAKVLLRDRAADKVLKEAKEAKARDDLAAEKAQQRGEVPVIGQASKAADVLEQSILQAESEGVPTSDKRMQQAVEIMKSLREADGQRKRMMNRQR